MKIVLLTITLIAAVTVNCLDRIKPPDQPLVYKESKSSDLSHFETLVGIESTLQSSKDVRNASHERSTCKPSKKCLKANGKCVDKGDCQGKIIRKGCTKPKGCSNSICCAPKITECKPSKKCKKAGGKCVDKKECNGKIIRNGCKKPKGCSNSICCASGKVNGGWTAWSRWSRCSTDCVQTRTRTCTKPSPSGGGAVCVGDSMEEEACMGGSCRPVMSNSEFVSKYNKTYTNQEEANKRMNIFKDNCMRIEEHNKRYEAGNSSFIMGINEFSDLTYDEVLRDLTGEREPDISQRSSASLYIPQDIGEEPSSIDYRHWGAVNPIRHQRGCGSCWAFSAIGSIESNIFLKRGILEQLSEQELVDCANAGGCPGGWKHKAIGYVIDHGISYRDGYPYTALDGNCNENTRKTSINIKTYKFVEYGNDADLLNALVHIGPLSVSIHVSANFYEYKSGILVDDLCATAQSTNHAVVLVGYGTENGKDYWLVRNSWGEGFGEKGYFKLSRNVPNHCFISAYGLVPVIEDECVSPWFRIGDQCFSLSGPDYSYNNLNWASARAFCGTLTPGGDLAQPKDIQALANYLFPIHHTYYWVGGSDLATEGQWRWLDGTTVTGWRQNEPNNAGGNEDCLAIHPVYGANSLFDRDCGVTQYMKLVCERP